MVLKLNRVQQTLGSAAFVKATELWNKNISAKIFIAFRFAGSNW
jgi:hypothetical protein